MHSTVEAIESVFTTTDLVVTYVDFSPLKKAELIKFVQEKVEDGKITTLESEALLKGKVAEIKARLTAKYGDPNALTSPEVTGFDPNDLIHVTVGEIQGLTDEHQARELIRDLLDETEYHFFYIGGVLAEMQARGYTGAYEMFWDYIEDEFGIKIRKAQMLIQIYHAVVGCGASWNEIKKIGWAKMAVLAPVLSTENYKDWFSAVDDGATHATLIKMVQDSKAAGENPTEGGAFPVSESTPIKKITLQVFEDQVENIHEALAKVKEESGTDHDGTAFHLMCIEKLAGPAKIPATTLGTITDVPLNEQIMKFCSSHTIEDAAEEVLVPFCGVYENADIEFYPEGKQSVDAEMLATQFEELNKHVGEDAAKEMIKEAMTSVF